MKKSNPEEIHRALRVRATQHGRSTEVEIRRILEDTVRPPERPKVGTALAAFGPRWQSLDLDITRDQTPTKPALFE